jgi:hypothetical protein
MLTRNYDRVQRYFPMWAIGLAVAERGLRAYFGLCPEGMVTKAGIPNNPSQEFIADSSSCLAIFCIGLMGSSFAQGPRL